MELSSKARFLKEPFDRKRRLLKVSLFAVLPLTWTSLYEHAPVKETLKKIITDELVALLYHIGLATTSIACEIRRDEPVNILWVTCEAKGLDTSRKTEQN